MAQELKAETIVPQGSTVSLQMYPKAEVDAVLAEKDAEIRRMQRALWLADCGTEKRAWLVGKNDLEKRAQLNIKQEESIRNHKYKRCLWLARWCASRSASWCIDPADEQLHKSDFYDKWKLRWLELSKKFKEAK